MRAANEKLIINELGPSYACIRLKGFECMPLSACSPRKFLEIRCSDEIASESRSRAVVATWLAEYFIQFMAGVHARV